MYIPLIYYPVPTELDYITNSMFKSSSLAVDIHLFY